MANQTNAQVAAAQLEKVVDKDALGKIWQALNLDQKVRAEDISVDQWLEITNCLRDKGSETPRLPA